MRIIPLDLAARAKAVQQQKDLKVARTVAGENDDLTPIVEVWRDGRLLCTAFAPNVNRDEGLRAYRMLVPALNADDAWLMTDAHITHHATNPHTNAPWVHGDMQRLCDNESACDLGLLTDCLVTCGRTRAGREYMVTQPYHVHKTARSVRWIDNQIEVMDSTNPFNKMNATGLVWDEIRFSWDLPLGAEAMTQAMSEDPLVRELAAGMEPWEMQAHMDIASYKVLIAEGYTLMVGEPADPKIAEQYRESGLTFMEAGSGRQQQQGHVS